MAFVTGDQDFKFPEPKDWEHPNGAVRSVSYDASVGEAVTATVEYYLKAPDERGAEKAVLDDIIGPPHVVRGDGGPIDWRPLLAFAYPLAACLLLGLLLKGLG